MHVDESRLLGHGTGGIHVSLIQLAGEHAARLQGPSGPLGERPEQIEPVGAPVQGERRLEIGQP